MGIKQEKVDPMASNSPDEFQLEIVGCPNCKSRVPKSIYCLKCGYPLYTLKSEYADDVAIEVAQDPFKLKPSMEDVKDDRSIPVPEVTTTPKVVAVDEEEAIEPEEEIVSEVMKQADADEHVQPVLVKRLFEEEPGLEEVEDVSIDVDMGVEEIEEDITFADELEEVEPEMMSSPEGFKEDEEETIVDEISAMEVGELETDFQTDSSMKGLTKDLMNGMSLKLWSINLLLEGRVNEDHFNRLFDNYQARLEQSTRRRNELLERASDLGSIETALNEARVGLGELEIRKSIGDLREGEYEAKAPAYNWDILHYEEELSKRNKEIALLEDLTRAVPSEEIANMKEMAEKAGGALDDLKRSGKISSETASKIKTTLDETKAFLKDTN
jgi:hypothetical protein